MKLRPIPSQGRRQQGFTYLGLIILVTIIGLAAVAALQVGALQQRRQAEQNLLLIGREFYDALISYANATPAGQSAAPSRLEDLLLDPRFPSIRRHLRRIVVDPMTGKAEWGVQIGGVSGGQGIVGIYSLSEEKPIKIDNFDPPFVQFKGKNSYRDWVFTTMAPALDPADVDPAAAQPQQSAPPAAKPPKPPGKT